jgi:activator of HSP90 ATPase
LTLFCTHTSNHTNNERKKHDNDDITTSNIRKGFDGGSDSASTASPTEVTMNETTQKMAETKPVPGSLSEIKNNSSIISSPSPATSAMGSSDLSSSSQTVVEVADISFFDFVLEIYAY